MNVWVCIASGQSLTHKDVVFCRTQGWQLATVNMGYKIAPDAHIFHAMDRSWWEAYGEEALERLSNACHVYSGSPEHVLRHGLRLITWDAADGCSKIRNHCHGGELSGIQLLQIVSWYKPDIVLMLGYDNQGKHWHEEYPNPTRDNGTINQARYATLYEQYPCPLINCSRETNIDSIPTKLLECMPDEIEAQARSKTSIQASTEACPEGR